MVGRFISRETDNRRRSPISGELIRTGGYRSCNTQYRYIDLIRRTRAEVFAIARKTLSDLAGESLEERMAEVFVQRLSKLNAEEKARLAAMSKSPNDAVHIRSAFELTPAQCKSIEEAVKATLTTKAPVQFETVPDLIGGIELILHGQKVAWSIADYIASLEKDVNELLKARNKEQHGV